MPLLRRATTQTAVEPKQESPVTLLPEVAAIAEATDNLAKPANPAKFASHRNTSAPMTKDDYWARREQRDIETGIRIRRSGVVQAAAMSVGTSQYCTGNTIDAYADVVEKLAERMLAWVQKD